MKRLTIIGGKGYLPRKRHPGFWVVSLRTFRRYVEKNIAKKDNSIVINIREMMLILDDVFDQEIGYMRKQCQNYRMSKYSGGI